MSTPFLFIATVLIWGTTWIAIAAQVGELAVTVSIFYRFALAGAVMLVGLAVMGRLRLPARWRYVIVQALCLFCLNFIALYMAASLIPSGLVSVIFSLASIFNAVNARLFFGEPVSGRTILAGSLGALGLLMLFWNDISVMADPDTLAGIGWAVVGTLFFSLGNMASRRNGLLGIPPLTANAWGMAIGALCLLAIVLLTGGSLSLPERASYWVALVYLAIIGSVIGFTTYLMLVARIGSAQAGYATVLFPIVALTASTLFEDYQWTIPAVIGVALACAGNIVMFRKRPAALTA